MNNKRQLIVSVGLALILVLMIVGISYAVFQFTGLGNKENSITTGVIIMKYKEGSNTLSLSNALPTTDATGKVRLNEGEYFDFTVESTIKGTTNINWEIAAEDITSSSVKKIDGSNIKLYLTSVDDSGNETEVMEPKVYSADTESNSYTGRPAGMMSLAKGSMNASETKKYRLRMYVDEDYNPQGDGGDLSFSIKINAYGKTGDKMIIGSKLKAYMTEDDIKNNNFPSTDFHTDDYRSKIASITTKKNNVVPTTAIESWDISEAGNGSVMAYVEDDGRGYSTYKLTIGGKDGIIANESMRRYFYNFSEITSMDLSALDTSEVMDMNNMFNKCFYLKSLNLSSFDTSQVTNMGDMFYECKNLKSLNVSNFDTSKVTNMSRMFYNCGLTNLDLSSFDTSQVTNMSSMFAVCGSLTTLDLSNFDTSRVTNMSSMFYKCKNLKSLNVSNFDTSQVTDMHYMFFICNSLTSLNVSNFDTSQVTDMSYMFDSCSKLTSLNVSNFDTSQVTEMHYMFYRCNSLTSLDFSNFDTSQVTNMSSMFEECSSLTSLDLSSFNTSEVMEMNFMFMSCSKLKSLDFRKATFDMVANSFNMFDSVPSTINIITKDATTKAWLEDKLGGNGTVTIA